MASPRAKRAVKTIGFGCPDVTDPHRMIVRVPRGRSEEVTILEHFGVAGVAGRPDEVERAALAREKWSLVADEVRRIFNERLQERGHATGRWEVGDNAVERLLGKELCVLAWAIEEPQVKADLVPVALANWTGLKPEERWWLFTMTAAATGEREHMGLGWRGALRLALTGNPTHAAAAREMAPRARPRRPKQASLFPSDATGSLPFVDDEAPRA